MYQPPQFTLADIHRRTHRTTATRIFYVLRRWPIIPILIIVALVTCAAFAEYISPNLPNRQDLRDRTAAPFWYPQCVGDEKPYFDYCSRGGKYILGADPLGRDVLSRIIHGARIALTLAVISITIGTLVGTTLGLVAGYFGRVVDEVIMRITDMITVVPYLLLALIIIVVLGQKYIVIVGVLAMASWPEVVRLVRGQTLQLKTLDYVALAKVSGASSFRILIGISCQASRTRLS